MNQSLPSLFWDETLKELPSLVQIRLCKTNSVFRNIVFRKRLKLRAASFDIGKTNFAQYVEEFEIDDLVELKKVYEDLPPAKRKKIKGELSDEVKFILDTIYCKSHRVSIGVFDFTDREVIGSKLNNEVRLNFLKHMEAYFDLWASCDIVIIEQQFINLYGKNRGINLDALKLGEAVHIWMLDRFPNKVVKPFGSQHKTQTLGAPPGLKKKQRKDWSIEFTEKLFTRRKDEDMLKCFQLSRDVKRKQFKTEERIQSFLLPFIDCPEDIKILSDIIVRYKQKLDDISDVVLQFQAYKFKKFITGC